MIVKMCFIRRNHGMQIIGIPDHHRLFIVIEIPHKRCQPDTQLIQPCSKDHVKDPAVLIFEIISIVAFNDKIQPGQEYIIHTNRPVLA